MEKGPFRITPFAPAHQQAARRLILDGLGEHWGWIDETINTDLENIAASYATGRFVLGWLGDRLVATGALVPEYENTKRIVRMSVARGYRRQGIGRQMLDHLLIVAREEGMKKVVLETTDTWGDVIAFYESCGFRVVGHDTGDVHMTRDVE